MVTVPSQYQQYINQAAQSTGLPVSVVAAQANQESGFNPNAVSSAGAEGFWQFLPSTYNSVASQAGIPPNTEFNVADETIAYTTYMNQLLQAEGGDVFKALEAYNAGPGNLAAGSGYATNILLNAGEPTSGLVATPNASLTSFNPLNPFSWFSGIGSSVTSTIDNAIKSTIENMFNDILKTFGIPSWKDLFQRLGLILLGAILVIVGVVILSKSPAVRETVNTGQKAAEFAALG